jgi:hypothetical protein
MEETKIARKHKHLCILKAPASWKPIPEYCAHNLLLIIYVGYNSFFSFSIKRTPMAKQLLKRWMLLEPCFLKLVISLRPGGEINSDYSLVTTDTMIHHDNALKFHAFD